MPTLTKETAKHHCRTCLKKLSPSERAAATDEVLEELKDIYINICANAELQRLLAKYVDGQLGDESERDADQVTADFPKNMCLSCYNKLHSFAKFQKRALESAEKLYAVLSCASGVTKIEIDEVDEEPEMVRTSAQQDDIYKLLLNDTLMETESVMLDTSGAATLASVAMHDPDPFGSEVPLTPSGKQERSVEEGAEDEDEDGDEEEEEDEDDGEECGVAGYDWHKEDSRADADSERYSSAATDSEEESKHKRCKAKDSKSKSRKSTAVAEEATINEGDAHATRSRGKRKLASAQKQNQQPEKKKRRTKQEMEEWRKSQAEKLEIKMKRRNKGTKNSFKCAQCNHCFAHKITLDAHVRKVHEGSKRPFQCDRCDKSYTFIGGLYTHIKEIHEAEVRSYSCDFVGCERIYTSFIAMQKHKRLKHTDTACQKKYVCEQCGATFNQSGNLKYHRRTKHPTEAERAEKEQSQERFECLICKKLFHSRYTLKYHTLQLHSNDMKYECNVCGRRMAKKFMLVQHMLVHSTDKMACEHCGKQFIRKFELEAHIRAVHMKLKPFECQYCSECFASRKTLRHHEYIHTGEKPYVCDICGQAYRQQTCLKNHRKSHEKLSAEALLAANINRTLMNTFLGPQQTMPTATAADASEAGLGISIGTGAGAGTMSNVGSAMSNMGVAGSGAMANVALN